MERIFESFRKQRFMQTLGARLTSCEPGAVTIQCDVTESLTQQHGYVHAGVLASLADSACGYAALSVMPENSEVVSVEFKISMLRPFTEKTIIAEGNVLRSGRSISFCEGKIKGEDGKIFASMTATMFRVEVRDQP